MVTELCSAAAAAAADAVAQPDGAKNRGDDEEIGMDRVLGLQALAEVATRMLEVMGVPAPPCAAPPPS